MEHRRRPGRAAAPKDTAADLPEDKSERVTPDEIAGPQPGPENRARAERIHEQIEEIKSGKRPDPEKPGGKQPSLREQIDRRMREIKEAEKDKSG